MVFEGGSDDGGGEVGRGRAPALHAKRKRVRKRIFVDVRVLKCVVGGCFCACVLGVARRRYTADAGDGEVVCLRARRAAAGYQRVGTKEKLLMYVVRRIETSWIDPLLHCAVVSGGSLFELLGAEA